MYGEWRGNKTVQFINSALRAEFMTYYEDKRDIMSDCVRPSWGISDLEKNRKVVIYDGGGSKSVFSAQVSAEEGNRLYMDIIELSRMWNPYKQRAAVENWAKNGGKFSEGQREWVVEGQKH